jgi:hypothetical protein
MIVPSIPFRSFKLVKPFILRRHLHKDDRVRIKGSTNLKDLNGIEGTIMGARKDAANIDSWRVRMDTGVIKRFIPKNLEVLTSKKCIWMVEVNGTQHKKYEHHLAVLPDSDLHVSFNRQNEGKHELANDPEDAIKNDADFHQKYDLLHRLLQFLKTMRDDYNELGKWVENPYYCYQCNQKSKQEYCDSQVCKGRQRKRKSAFYRKKGPKLNESKETKLYIEEAERLNKLQTLLTMFTLYEKFTETIASDFETFAAKFRRHAETAFHVAQQSCAYAAGSASIAIVAGTSTNALSDFANFGKDFDLLISIMRGVSCNLDAENQAKSNKETLHDATGSDWSYLKEFVRKYRKCALWWDPAAYLKKLIEELETELTYMYTHTSMKTKIGKYQRLQFQLNNIICQEITIQSTCEVESNRDSYVKRFMIEAHQKDERKKLRCNRCNFLPLQNQGYKAEVGDSCKHKILVTQRTKKTCSGNLVNVICKRNFTSI